MKYVVKESFWTSESVRELCIHHHLYNCGDCEEYDQILRFVEDNCPTEESIYHVASDIKSHSDTEYEIPGIMTLLINESVKQYYRWRADQ